MPLQICCEDVTVQENSLSGHHHSLYVASAAGGRVLWPSRRYGQTCHITALSVVILEGTLGVPCSVHGTNIIA